jgi:SAM-dependent methyltransferase
MSELDRQRWDNIYRQRSQEPFPEPDPLLFEFTPPPEGEERALDLAAGMGQNGLWLASQGYVVDVIDISRMALIRGRNEMARRDLRNINFLLQDLDHMDLEDDYYALVCVFRYLKRDLFSQVRACTQSGGRVIYETFNRSYLKIVPNFNVDFLLEPGELASYFADWKILHSSDSDHISRLAAIKP